MVHLLFVLSLLFNDKFYVRQGDMNKKESYQLVASDVPFSICNFFLFQVTRLVIQNEAAFTNT